MTARIPWFGRRGLSDAQVRAALRPHGTVRRVDPRVGVFVRDVSGRR
jgi:hypothetical protein